MWRETAYTADKDKKLTISIHSLRVEGDAVQGLPVASHPISIHSLRVEGDIYRFGQRSGRSRYFNPLPPCGGRLLLTVVVSTVCDFNPLPPCGGRRSCGCDSRHFGNFNPLPPCGGRRSLTRSSGRFFNFNPLPPCGGRRCLGFPIRRP